MQFTARLVQVLPLQSGTGRNGEWKKQDIIVETEGQYPKKVCVSMWGDKINESVLQVNNLLDISFEVESREYNGRWYTDVRAWRIELAGSGETVPPFGQEVNAPLTPPADLSAGDADDLPF